MPPSNDLGIIAYFSVKSNRFYKISQKTLHSLPLQKRKRARSSYKQACSLHGAGNGNRTRSTSLGSWGFTTRLCPHGTLNYSISTYRLSSNFFQNRSTKIVFGQSLKSKTAFPFSNLRRPSNVLPVLLEVNPVILAVLPSSRSNLMLETEMARPQM